MPYKNPYSISLWWLNNSDNTPKRPTDNSWRGRRWNMQTTPVGSYQTIEHDVDEDVEEPPLELEDWMFGDSYHSPYDDLSDVVNYGKKSYRKAKRNMLSSEEKAQRQENRAYKRNVLGNSISQNARYAPLLDSVIAYFQKKRDTPDYSGLENYKNYAMRETPVSRHTANHITGNMKFNPYDYTETANRIQAQSAAAQNLAARQGRGNTNMLMAHINNLLTNTATNIGKANLDAWRANEAQRMAVAQENRRADEFNANADNSADAAYITSLNAQRAADKQNAINALQYYDQQKYARDAAYKAQLDAKRNEMVSNIGDFGREAYDKNTVNTDQAYNYWTDNNGIHHYIPSNGGARPVDEKSQVTTTFDNDFFKNFYDNYATDDEKGLLTPWATDADKREWMNNVLTNRKKANGKV